MRYQEPVRDPVYLERMQATFELYELAVKMQTQNLRRAHPEASPEEIQELLNEWLEYRPGAELGDAEGRPSLRFGLVPNA